MASLVFRSVSFAYDSSIDGLFSELRFGLSEGWTGVLGENGSGKTTLLHLACRELVPRQGGIDAPAFALRCPQRTDAPLPQSRAFLDATDAAAFRLRALLGIGDDGLARWETLSHGERKRIQIATCLWVQPDLLAVDEPTNHLDARTKGLVERALRTYRGIGLLVSHDRYLLDGLCSHSLFVSPPHVTLRAGGYTVATGAVREEERAAREERKKAHDLRRRLEREAHDRRSRAEAAEKAKSLHGVGRRDHDARAKARGARVRDAGSGQGLRQLEGRIRQASERESSIGRTAPRSLGLGLRTGVSDRNAVVRVDAGSLPLGPDRRLEFPDLIVQPRDRVALTGPNGSGKSTLVRRLLSDLTLPPERVLYIPQEIPAERSSELLKEVKRLPDDELGRAMQWVSRLGSDPRRILASRLPSPGEVRKLLLATKIAQEPHWIVMDEPTNHMDLPSIECLESALKDVDCALLLVSHDRRFLEALASWEWTIVSGDPSNAVFQLFQRPIASSTPDALE